MSSTTSAPLSSDIIAFANPGQRNLTLSSSVNGLEIAMVSAERSSFLFDKDFDIISGSNQTGYFGYGDFGKREVSVNGTTYFELYDSSYSTGLGDQPHGVIRFKGSVSSVNWLDQNYENWHGITVGINKDISQLNNLAMLNVVDVLAGDVLTVLANPNIQSINVSDTSDNIANNLDVLEANLNKISCIALTDSSPITITETQLINDSGALSKIAGQSSVNLNGLPADLSPVLNPQNGHYYQIIKDYGVTALDALNRAQSYIYRGQTGYLATITSADENSFVSSLENNANVLGDLSKGL